MADQRRQPEPSDPSGSAPQNPDQPEAPDTAEDGRGAESSCAVGTAQRARANPNGTEIDTSWHDRFLDSLKQHGIVRLACQEVVIGRRTAYYHREHLPEFAKRWEDALEDHRDLIRAEVIRRGIEGVSKGIFYRGERVAVEKEYSDRMLELHAKALCPEYRERFQMEHSGEVGLTVRDLIAAGNNGGFRQPPPIDEGEHE